MRGHLGALSSKKTDWKSITSVACGRSVKRHFCVCETHEEREKKETDRANGIVTPNLRQCFQVRQVSFLSLAEDSWEDIV